MKTFYSAEDIENFAERGQREISVDENTVLTDMAKQTAHMLGIRITEKSAGSSPGHLSPAGRQSPTRSQTLGSKPKGCQRRPANKSPIAPGPRAGESSPVVDKLVEKIKRISGQNG